MPEYIQRSFTSGEISPSLQSRADIVKYATGLNLCENYFVRAQGGAYSRPGFRFGGTLADQTKKGVLIPFAFNTEQTYMLVFEDLLMRVIKDNAYVLKAAAVITDITQANPAVVTSANTFTDGETVVITGVVGMTEVNGNSYTVANATSTDYELAGIDSTGFTAYTSDGSAQSDGIFSLVTPYTEAELPYIAAGVTQSADVMTIVNHNHDPRNLNRLADDDWTLTVVDYSSSTTAPTGLTLAAVGTGFGSYSKTYEYVVTAVKDGVESLASTSNSIAHTSLTVTGGINLTWTAVAGAEYYRVYKDPSVGTGMYGWIGDTINNNFDDYNIAPVVSDAPPQDRQPFTADGDKPSVVTYYQQRQIFANTLNEPQTVFTTQTANYNSLRTSNPARDDDAITFTVVGRQVNEIRHMISLDALILLTSGGEWKTTEGQDQVLIPSTIGVRQQSYNGSSWVPPVVVNSTALYLQEKGSRLRDLGYEFTSDKYTGNDLSLMSEHLFEGHEITSMAFAQEPYGILWCVRDDGVLLGLTYQKEQQVWGWHHHVTDGEFEFVATVSEGDRDATYTIIKRTINGGVKRYIERLDPRVLTTSEDAFCVDSGLTYDGAPATVISGLDHLEGEAVAVVADGYEVTGLTVASGSITLARAASKVHVGLAYLPIIELLDIDSSSSVDTVKSKSVSVSKVYIEVEKSIGGWVGPRLDAEVTGDPVMVEIKPRFDADGYDPISLRTFKQEVVIQPQWSKGGGVRIEQRSPFPLSILSVIPSVDVGGN